MQAGAGKNFYNREGRSCIVTDYIVPDLGDKMEIGLRARRLRDLLGMTAGQVASEARVEEHDVIALEQCMDVSLQAALAIHGVLSTQGVGDTLFTRPRLRTIDEVHAFESRRLDSR